MPAIRYWADTVDGVTDLAAVPSLALALRRHQYCGVILFGKNIVDAEQTTRLIADLQANNAQGIEDSSQCVPYFVAADQEGGTVARLNMGTRGTGSMAIAASGEQAESNARATGRLFGEELAALGINVDLGPCVDIISDLTDMGMSTRVFSDDASVVGMLGNAFAEGLSEQGVVACFKHFPGAGDGSDYPTAINISLEELKRKGIRAYASVIDAGAEMIMTAATTFPALDEEHVLADGITTGCYPATMSKRIVTDMLRDELAYDGVVITDALEMEQFFQEPLTGASILPGEKYSVELAVAIACKCLEAGCDILLIPTEHITLYHQDYLLPLYLHMMFLNHLVLYSIH
jgi:beta-N-acetylhexosaminidase